MGQRLHDAIHEACVSQVDQSTQTWMGAIESSVTRALSADPGRQTPAEASSTPHDQSLSSLIEQRVKSGKV